MISEEQLATWKRLATEATRGPWYGPNQLSIIETGIDVDGIDHGPDRCWACDPEGEFEAAAPVLVLDDGRHVHGFEYKRGWVGVIRNGSVEPLVSEESVDGAGFDGDGSGSMSLEDAAFVVCAREAIPALISEVERLRAIVDGKCTR